jgi:hypothetical protein
MNGGIGVQFSGLLDRRILIYTQMNIYEQIADPAEADVLNASHLAEQIRRFGIFHRSRPKPRHRNSEGTDLDVLQDDSSRAWQARRRNSRCLHTHESDAEGIEARPRGYS